tara:strand:+ start:2185 stop:3240 length:1056 start_codon:yes stop_codon:yes gene_type:complete
MERINYNSLRFNEIFDKLSPQNSGILFSVLLHLIILLSAVGLPNFFPSKDIYVPNIIPIEILNVSETTNIEKSDKDEKDVSNKIQKKIKFNSSNNTEVQKKLDISQNTQPIMEDKPEINVEQKNTPIIKEKKIEKIKQKDNVSPKTKIETIKTDEIKPKLKPELKKIEPTNETSDLDLTSKNKIESKVSKKEVPAKPKSKPQEDFSIASMLKDLRNEKSNNINNEDAETKDTKQNGQDKKNENMILSISEVDLLRQQLSSCWNAPAGAVINIGDKVTISAKVQQNMKVFENSVRIVDTNISKSNPFYGPITDSAMRTLLNPECTPLKLPKDKYNLWKNLTITFDYSIMKGY